MNKVIAYLNMVLCIIASLALGNAAEIEVNLNFRHEVGGVDSFDRSKFITIHSDPGDNEWNHGSGSAVNFTDDLIGDFIDGYDVYFGRATGAITYWLTNEIEEDPTRPGFSSLSNVQHWGNYARNNYEANTAIHQYEAKWGRSIVAGHLFPFYPGGSNFPGDPTSSRRCGPAHAKWDFSTADTALEPWGTATGEYMARYLKYFHGGPGETGMPRPGYFTIVNEPLYWLSGLHDEPPAKVFEFFNTCAAEVRKEVPDIKIAGYTTAHPNFEVDNFQRWEERWKSFIDVSGDSMDLWCIHLYDNAGQQGKQTYRRGGNVEATFDMIEQYSQMRLGEQKSFLISEYGATAYDYEDQLWSPWKDWLGLKSLSALMMTFMDRPHLIETSIPFILIKAEWAGSPPHGRRLMRQAWEGEGETGDHWVYSELIKFYQLWSDVKGTRVDSYSTEADIQTDAYVDQNKVYVILNNLEFTDLPVNLQLVDRYGNQPQSIRLKHLYLNDTGTAPVLDDLIISSTNGLVLGSEGTMVLEYTFASPVLIDQSSIETKYYASDYLKEITSSTPLVFDINGVSHGSYGEAVLRISMGRNHGKSLKPTVLFNGSPLVVPVDWKGDMQSQKDRFFGMLEVPVPNELLQNNNTVSIEFPDDGGHVSSVTMQVFEFSAALEHADTSLIGQTIALKAKANNKYVCADNVDPVNRTLWANRTAVGGWEKFVVVDAGGGLIALKANANGKYVSSDPGLNWSLAANRTAISGLEKFTWILNSDGTVSLKANGNGQYICADRKLNSSAPPLEANRTSIGTWEKFTVEIE
ncbi:beta-agarase [Coraliomargarita akajimensis]|uniref:Beta-agarase n=1 Tax=Coraliomargarita akajimensis (strain DSM 45221 / IAM 15411 / JCM 23193 / KCTC 12865 / 04OKA010-24) TaxID=583355 RepID=D5ER24_CORAD|nr:beta-agarase [Coraliomargarita akajimensis]ADE54017.1 Beta-agarase [Coraliomargarita akajimensis DSM 45221]